MLLKPFAVKALGNCFFRRPPDEGERREKLLNVGARRKFL